MSDLSGIVAGMKVIGADGVPVGVVAGTTSHAIVLEPPGEGPHADHKHTVPAALIAEIEGQSVRLSANAAVAVTFEEES